MEGKKMTNQTQDKGRTYTQIYLEVQALSEEMNRVNTPLGFHAYLARLGTIQAKYVQGFDQMKHVERQDASLLINMVLSQLHGRLDVLRARAMNGELKPRK